MKNRYILFGLLIFAQLCLTAQEEPRVLLQFNFEDSRGNRDTVWIGVDREASSTMINPQFGEEAITEPWDSVFEARAAHRGPSDPLDYESSEVIVDFSDAPLGDNCILFAPSHILIHSKYPPVRISWDGDYVENQDLDKFCHLSTFFAPTQNPQIVQFWWEAPPHFCLYGRSEMTLDPYRFDENYDIVPLTRLGILEGQDTVEIPVLILSSFLSFPGEPTCEDIILSTEEELGTERDFSVYPNPASSMLYLESEEVEIDHIDIFNMDGKSLLSYEGTANRPLDVSSLRPGLYWLRIRDREGRETVRRFVKQ